MRMIAEHPEQKLIGKFVNYLKSRGIGAEIRPRDKSWSLWVHHEDACCDVRQEFDDYLADPADDKYMVETAPAPGEKPQEPRKTARKPFWEVGFTARRRGPAHGYMPVTILLLVLSVVATLPYLFGLRIAEPVIQGLRTDGRVALQWWRLFTPAFLHFSWLHILFNMLWLRELGSRIERRKGPWFMLVFFLATSGVSNYAQWVAGEGQLFGGMSGVVYGLFGYIWIKSRLFPEEGFSIDQGTVMMLMLWFFLGWTGILPIANWAHGFGLGSGMALALAPGMRRNPPPDPLGD